VQHISGNVESLISATAEFFIEQCTNAVRKNGRFTVALSGGSSPKKLFALLASEKYRQRLSWENIYFFFGDERYVPSDDAQSNYRMAKETLFTPLNIGPGQIMAVDTTVSPAESATKYEQTIRKHFQGACRFDLILLGLGDDAHTASLFPHTDVLNEQNALVKEVFVSKVNQFRITFTAPLINEASTIAFLTYGATKAEAVHHILKDPFNPTEYPAQLVKPVSGKVHWFLDEEAASRII
jgi:6-phosphogluconolactonase